MERLPSFHVQIQKPASRSPTLTAFVFLAKFAEFFNYKNLKQEVHDDLSVCADERSPCGLSIILSMSRDQKVMKLLTQWRKTYELLSRSFYCPNLISPSATRDQEICPSHLLIRWWLNWILWMRFTWCPNLMFLAFPWLERYRFSNWPFCCPWAIQSW